MASVMLHWEMILGPGRPEARRGQAGATIFLCGTKLTDPQDKWESSSEWS